MLPKSPGRPKATAPRERRVTLRFTTEEAADLARIAGAGSLSEAIRLAVRTYVAQYGGGSYTRPPMVRHAEPVADAPSAPLTGKECRAAKQRLAAQINAAQRAIAERGNRHPENVRNQALEASAPRPHAATVNVAVQALKASSPDAPKQIVAEYSASGVPQRQEDAPSASDAYLGNVRGTCICRARHMHVSRPNPQVELTLAADAEARGWAREVERHRATAARLEGPNPTLLSPTANSPCNTVTGTRAK